MRSTDNYMDRKAYEDYLSQQKRIVEEHSSNYQKYVISAYAYFRSRLLVPGRCYEDESRGMLAVGGSAHLDIIDLDIWMKSQPSEAEEEFIDWASGSSLEQTAYWRGLGKYSASTIKRRRDKLLKQKMEDENAKLDTQS